MPRDTPDLISTDITSGVFYRAYGPVPSVTRYQVAQMMSGLSDIAQREVRSARVKVKRNENRNPDQTSIGQGKLDVSGTAVRAEAAAATPREALQTVGKRLADKLDRLFDARSRGGFGPARQRDSDDESYYRPDFFYRAPQRRAVVRRKTYTPADRYSVSEALFALEALDYRFFIFTNEADDKTAVVYEVADGVAVREVDGSRPDPESVPADLHVNEAGVPSIAVAEAVSRLNTGDMTFVFFVDSDRERPSVLYRRYDGHYGILMPSSSIV